MTSFAAERPSYFEGQYIGADDLTALVTYFRTQDARHILGQHTWGIAVGLDLTEIEAPDGTLEIYLQPGLAFDGYGRVIAVLNRTKLEAELFEAGAYTGEIEVWIRFDESESQGVRKGFEVCSSQDNFSRVNESFAIEVGSRSSILDRQSGVVVNAESIVDAREALHQVNEEAPLICDGSTGHQDLPLDQTAARWLVPLGLVHRLAGSPGSFQALTAEGQVRSRLKRRHAGVVAESLYAADGVIRLRHRHTAFDATQTTDALCAESQLGNSDLYNCETGGLSARELIWLEGHVRVTGDTRLFGGRLEFRDEDGTDYVDRSIQGTTLTAATPLLLQRKDANSRGGSDLQILLGQSDTGINRLTIGPIAFSASPPAAGSKDDPLCDEQATSSDKVVIQDNGMVGIGAVNSTLAAPLTIRGIGDENEQLAFEDENGQLLWQVNLGPNKDSLNFVETADDASRLYLEAGGNVGVGTNTPGDKLEVFDASTSGLGGLTIHRGRYACLQIISDNYWAGIELRRDGGGEAGRPHIDFTNDLTTNYGIRISAPTNNDLAIEGGDVGIGTTSPDRQLHIKETASSSSNGLRIENEDNTRNLRLWVGTHGGVVDAYTGANLHLRTNGTDRLFIKNSNGHVGIGTTSPDSKLTIQGNGGALRLYSGTNNGHFWIGLYTDGSPGSTRAGWMGYGSDGTDDLTIKNEKSGGRIVLNPANEDLSDGVLDLNGEDINCNNDLYLNWFSKNEVIVGGDLTVQGSKSGYVIDRFINKSGEDVEQGDVVVLGKGLPQIHYGLDDNIPVPEIDLTTTAYDQRVCGIVAEILVEKAALGKLREDSGKARSERGAHDVYKGRFKRMQEFSDEELTKLNKKKVSSDQIGKMVTLGCFAHCKVDADIAPVEVGDLLTSSPTKGHAQKVLAQNKSVGAIIGKALGALKKGKGKIPALVIMQ